MRRWDVVMVELPAPLSWHPVVIISPQEIIDDAGIRSVNGLLCSTIRGDDTLGRREVFLHREDGPPQKSGCQCHALLLIPKHKISPANRLGSVSAVRRAEIIQHLRALLEL